MSSLRNRENQKEKLTLSLANAESTDKMLKIFNKMEQSTNPRYSETELDLNCIIIADKLHTEGKDFEKVLTFGKRGLKFMLTEIGKASTTKFPCFGDQKVDISNLTLVFTDDGTICSSNFSTRYNHYGKDIVIPYFLNMLGSVCCELKRFGESISYYNWSARNLTKLLEKDCPDGCFMKKLEETERCLYDVKRAMGRAEEAVSHMKKILECKEKRLKEGCLEIGEAYKDVYEACYAAVEFKEALPYCLKALEIYRKHFGGETVEIAEMTRILGSIYGHLEEFEKAYKQKELAKSILKKVAPGSSDMIALEIGVGQGLNELGRYKEGINVLRAVAAHTDAKAFERAIAYVGMAEASLSLGKLSETEKYIRTAQRIYDKEEMNPLHAAAGFEQISKMYEKMNDLENSISMVIRALKVPKLPEKLVLEASSRLFSLYSRSGKEEEGIPYLEDAVEKLKESFGPEHIQVGYGYAKLAHFYLNSAQEELALKVLEKAKKIMDVSLGPNHKISLLTSHHLSDTYSKLGSLELAIELEEKVVEGYSGLGPSGEDYLIVAIKQLSKLKLMKIDPDMFSYLTDQLRGLGFSV